MDVPEYTFATGSEIVMSSQSSEILINAGSKLILNGTSVHGCIFSWKRIVAKSGSSLIIASPNIGVPSRIRDGAQAIVIEPNASFSITGTTFEMNLVSVLIGDPNAATRSAVNFTAGGGFGGNIFDGSGTLKAPYLNISPLRGMEIWFVQHLDIGSASGSPNEFKNFALPSGSISCNGILIGNSEVSVKNSIFNNIVNPLINTNASRFHSGIAATMGSSLTVDGLGGSASSANTFALTRTGIYLDGSSGVVRNAKFDQIDEGIVYLRGATAVSVPHILTVNNSTFNGYVKRGVNAESGPSGSSLHFSSFQVSNCDFNDNSALTGTRTAILVHSSFPASVGDNFSINNNDLKKVATGTTFGQIFTAISLSNIYGGIVYSNDITNEQSQINEFRGIVMADCNKVQVYSNDITGFSATAFQTVGIQLTESPYCKVGCNDMDKLRMGANFYGNSQGLSLYSNRFYDHGGAGLYMQADAVIGEQKRKYNRWYGNSSPVEAYWDFFYDPLDPDDIDHIKQSRFTIVPSSPNTEFWADPRLVGADMQNNPYWFVGGEGTLPVILYCPIPAVYIDPWEPDYLEKGVMQGTHTPYKGYAATTWDAGFQLYHVLANDPGMRPEGSLAADFYSERYDEPMGKLQRVFDGYLGLTDDTATATASELLNDLNGVNPVDLPEKNLSDVLTVFLEMAASGASSLSTSQLGILENVAGQCRYEGGFGVRLARAALGMGETANDQGCSGERSKPRNQTKQINVSVFPNPAEQAFTVQLDRDLQDGSARLYTTTGLAVDTWLFHGRSLDLRDLDLSPGIYFLEVREGGQTLDRIKIIISR